MACGRLCIRDALTTCLVFAGPVSFFLLFMRRIEVLERPSVEEVAHSVHQESDTQPSTDHQTEPHSYSGSGQVNVDSPVPSSHREIFSLLSQDHRFSHIDFHPYQAFNPNTIPHPHLADTWIVVAQEVKPETPATAKNYEVACNAVLNGDKLVCIDRAVRLPIATIPGKGCKEELGFMELNIGPHDARLIFAPDNTPYILFGSNSDYTCFGWFIQSLASLIDDYDDEFESKVSRFRYPIELQRPTSYSDLEKNFFLFWGVEGNQMIHHDIYPRRVFAELHPDGSVGPDLAPAACEADQACLDGYLPKPGEEHESIHQATNSLRVTLCDSGDATCIVDKSKTVIIHIAQYKTYYNFHSEYEPYVVAFHQRAPYELYGISKRPLWIHGRTMHPEKDTSDMFYVTSMNWKSSGRGYQGYLDDEIMLTFGIEDGASGVISLTAEHLLEDLGLCVDV